MKRKIVFLINILILILIVALLIFFCTPNISENDDNKIKIIATIFPNYDFAKQIGGDKVEVKLLLGSGVESHTYEPTPKDMIKIDECNMFIYTGTEFEPWAKEILDSNKNDFYIIDTSKDIQLIEKEDFEKRNLNSEILQENEKHQHENSSKHVHAGIEHESSYDSHIWLSPTNALVMIDNVLEGLCEIDSENAEYYTENAEKYKKQILDLDNKFEEMIKKSKIKELAFAGEFSYTYFIDKYDLKFVSVYNNCGHGEDPSVAKVKSIIDYINNHNLPVVFYEELSEGNVAKMIEDETKSKARVFFTIHNANIEEDTYITLMEKNYENLKEALN